MSQRVTQRITRMWGHRKNVGDANNPGQTKSVEVLEVKITERNLAYLKEAVRVAEERIATLKQHFGAEAIADQDRRVNERVTNLPEDQQKTLTYSMPKLQLWPGNNDSEKDLTLFAEAIKSLPPVQEKAEEDLPEEGSGFDGVGSLFG